MDQCNWKAVLRSPEVARNGHSGLQNPNARCNLSKVSSEVGNSQEWLQMVPVMVEMDVKN